MELNIHGFKAEVKKQGDLFIGTIDKLHIQEQAKSIKELEHELTDAVNSILPFLDANKNLFKP